MRQTSPPLEVVVVVDYCDPLLERARAEFIGTTVIPNAVGKGASGARNTGVAASCGEVIAFLDDDAVADPAWLEMLRSHYPHPNVIGVGGRLKPLWEVPRPRWFPPEFGWVVGASYRGMPEQAAPTRNVWSGNMSVRREVFDRIGGFREGFGKVGSRSRPEDTDLCLRAREARPGGTWIYEPASVAWHRVPAQRTTVRFFLSRCFSEGRGKADLAVLDGVGDSTSVERRYAWRVLPRGMIRGVGQFARGDIHGGSRSLAIAAGLSWTLAGYSAGRVAAATRAGRWGGGTPADTVPGPVTPAALPVSPEREGEAQRAYSR